MSGAPTGRVGLRQVAIEEEEGREESPTPGIDRTTPDPRMGVDLVLKPRIKRETFYSKPEYENNESDDSLIL